MARSPEMCDEQGIDVIRAPLHDQVRAAFDATGMTEWELSRRANVRESLVTQLFEDEGRRQLEVLERIADSLALAVSLVPISAQLHVVGDVPSVVDEALMRTMPDRCTRAGTHVPKVLALDLEGTLISNAVSVFPRPGLHRFLECCRGLFPRIAMFTTVPEHRFRSIANLLVEEGAAPSWYASVEYIEWSGRTKDLQFVPGAEPEDVLLVDDLELYVHPGQGSQWVSVAGFEPPFTQPDGELDRLLEVLARRACLAA